MPDGFRLDLQGATLEDIKAIEEIEKYDISRLEPYGDNIHFGLYVDVTSDNSLLEEMMSPLWGTFSMIKHDEDHRVIEAASLDQVEFPDAILNHISKSSCSKGKRDIWQVRVMRVTKHHLEAIKPHAKITEVGFSFDDDCDASMMFVEFNLRAESYSRAVEKVLGMVVYSTSS